MTPITLSKKFRKTKLTFLAKKSLKSTIIYNKKIAKRFHDIRYYEAMGSDVRNLPNREKEKNKYATRRRIRITELIRAYKTRLNRKSQGIFLKLKGLYDKNVRSAFYGLPMKCNSHLLHLVSSVPMLYTAYKAVKGNKGALTPAWILSIGRYNRLFGLQKSYLKQTYRSPDEINRNIFQLTSYFLRKGQYPWGASRRVYIPKPGQPGKLRPITIPPFMDRVVQQSITMVLQAIYEPLFEYRNRNFGFRPSKGVHDAIHLLTGGNARGLNHAIEGDIKAAYDKVNRQKLLDILSLKIKDRGFINLISQRLDYQFWDTQANKFVEDKEGIPQGGTDSPYLWNIYMLEFDNYVHTKAQAIFDKLNRKVRRKLEPKAVYPSPERRSMTKYAGSLRFIIRNLNKNSNSPNAHSNLDLIFGNPKIRAAQSLPSPLKLFGWSDVFKNKENLTAWKHRLIRELRGTIHRRLRLPPTDPSRKYLKFLYCRYADDWIFLTNAPMLITEQLKEDFATFLSKELHATLSIEKTLITDMTQNPAHFLGFELHMAAKSRIVKQKISEINPVTGRKLTTFIKNQASKTVFALPDKQRLISRLHMKRYCDEAGFPREIPWISGIETFAIIERYNSVLRGLANFYTEFVKSPSRMLSRWVYIIRYSCLKTLAQKYKTTIGGILRRFRSKPIRGSKNKSKTISVTIRHTFKEGEVYSKTWRLFTLLELLAFAKKVNRLATVRATFNSLEQGIPQQYKPSKGRNPAITDMSFLDKIQWVNLRTQASFDLPCSMCGSDVQVEMHHLKSIRKQRYELLTSSLERIMALRNRKQVPLCRECHMQSVHAGRYAGPALNKLVPKVMYDNRLIHLESFIKPGKEYFAKTLVEKGWKPLEVLI